MADSMVSLMVDLMAVLSASKRVRYSVASMADLMVCKMDVKAEKMAHLMVSLMVDLMAVWSASKKVR